MSVERLAICVRTAAVALLLLAVAATGCAPPDRFVPPEDDRAGRAYIAALRAGRVDEVRALTKPATAGLPTFPAVVAEARARLLNGAADTVQLIEFERVLESGAPPATKLVYRARAARIELWVEQDSGRRVIETVRVGAPGSS